MMARERPAADGELCTCGRQAVTVYETNTFGDVPYCGEPAAGPALVHPWIADTGRYIADRAVAVLAQLEVVVADYHQLGQVAAAHIRQIEAIDGHRSVPLSDAVGAAWSTDSHLELLADVLYSVAGMVADAIGAVPAHGEELPNAADFTARLTPPVAPSPGPTRP